MSWADEQFAPDEFNWPSDSTTAHLADKTISAIPEEDIEQVETSLEGFWEWGLESGKVPRGVRSTSSDVRIPLSESTMKSYRSNLNRMFRWMVKNKRWEWPLTKEVADDYIGRLITDDVVKTNGGEYAHSYKRKVYNALLKYFEWRKIAFEKERWTPAHVVVDLKSNYNSYEPFNLAEAQELLHEVWEFDEIQTYDSLSESERRRLSEVIGTELDIDPSQIGRQFWSSSTNRRYSLHWPSLLHVAIEAGLTSGEVRQATLDWVDLDRGVIRVPDDEVVKGRTRGEMYLTDRTSDLLRRWLTERDCYDAYTGTNAIWLNSHGNRHNSATLNDFLYRLIEETTISVGDRNIVWHSLRKTTGTYSSSEGGRGVARAILGHEFKNSTELYNMPPEELIRKALRHLYPDNRRR